MLFHVKINLTSRINPRLRGEKEGVMTEGIENPCVLDFYLYSYGSNYYQIKGSACIPVKQVVRM